MSKLWKGFFASVFCTATLAASAAPQNAENFARRPQMRGVTLSADGRYVAFLSGLNDDSVLMTYDRKSSGEFKRVAASEPQKFDIGWCRWANPARVVCGIFGNTRGNKYADPPFKRLFAVNGDGSALKVLEKGRNDANLLVATTSMRNFNMNYGAALEHGADSPYARVTSDVTGTAVATKYVASFTPERQDEVIDFTPDDPDNVLIQSDEDRNGYPSVVQLNILTGARAEKFPEVQPIQVFVTDGHGNPRLGWGVNRAGETRYFARLDSDREWRPLSAIKTDVQAPLRPFAIGIESSTAYAYGAYEGRDALWSIDLADQRPPKLLFAHELVDVGQPLLRSDRRLLGVRYDVERPYVWYTNPKHRELIERLERIYPNQVHEIIDASDDQQILLIQSSSDIDAGTYYLYDVDKDKLQKLGTAYPELDPNTLGSMRNITYKATDGTEIPGYLTIPTGAEKKNLPLIVMPHDGPDSRDSWQFSYLRTFLANRGYAVLQPNYRGSSGFGEKWRAAAKNDWGGIVYSDIQDATRWAVSEGIADPKRVCILGWGFGGYEALLSAARNTDTYKCAVSVAGISDLEAQRDQGTAYNKANARREISRSQGKHAADSPLENAEKVNIPVLLIHGTRDWQVQMDQSQEMGDALEEHDKDVTVVMIKNGTHDLDGKSDRLTLLKEVETFLKTNLGAGAGP
jgi:dipeptidyl aminopeptidase/acylaminoacyl peptidase